MQRLFIFTILCCGLLLGACQKKRSGTQVLVFTKTQGYRHQSIPVGIETVLELGKENGFSVDTTEDASFFREEKLSQYSAVIFLNTTHDVLNHRQQAEFERYIQAGGGFVGVHAAADTEYDWPWYGRLVGARFSSHPNEPNVRTASMKVVDKSHPSTAFLPDAWERSDEFYNFKDIYEGIKPLVMIDESSYEGGTNGEQHPMSWYHEYDGGRSWYTNFGHTDETYAEPAFRQHLLEGIRYAIGQNLELDYIKAHSLPVPDEKRFVMEVLDEGLNEPGEMDFLPNGNIIFTERRGNVKIYNPATRSTKVAGTIDVYTKSEDGLLGVALDPDFATNHVLYLYYSPNIERSINILSSFVMRGDSLLLASEKQLLEVEVQRRECCHTGGSIQFGPDGNLFLSTGDNTNPFETRYAPINEVANRGPWDAQKSSANTNDLRGKILRIRPNDQGGYDIPDGNLFPKDGSAGRPEIYVMGCRNPYRISIDRKNRYLYWGDVGPDGRVDSTRGPKGYDEINQARQPGFFGWPLFIGNNKAYRDVDFATQKLGDWFDPKNPVNDSPNNTGLKALPPAKPAFIWYPYDESKEFPIVGKGGRNAMAGPVYYHDLFAGAESQFPAYYDGKLFIYDFMRDWVFAVSMDENNNLETIEPFLPELKLSSPMDMEFGPDGALYVLEYGTQWFAANPDARLIRISYADGNRKPVAMIQTDRHIGAAPFTVQFSARSSFDHDPEDQLQYRWEFPDGSTQEGVQVNYTFQDNGNFHPKLTVRDGQGGESSTEIEIQVGNAPPKIEVKLDGNQTFFWKDRSIDYSVEVSDQEDGSLSSGGISPNDVRITFGFLGNTKDRTQADQDHAATALASMIKTGGELIGTSGCTACHGVENEVVGPAYQKVSARYENQADAEAYLIRKILEGGQGVWGGKAMPAQSQLSDDQAKSMALYILSLAKKEKPLPSLPSNGRLLTNQHQGLGEGSSYTFQVSYEDRGGEAIGPLAAYESITLRPAQITAAEIDPVQSQDIEIRTNGRAKPPHKQARLKEGSYAYFAPVDLTGIVALSMRYDSPAAGRTLEVRLDSPNGPLYTSFTSQATKGKFIIDEHQVNPVEGEHALYLLAKTGSGPEDSRVLASFHWMYMQNGQES